MIIFILFSIFIFFGETLSAIEPLFGHVGPVISDQDIGIITDHDHVFARELVASLLVQTKHPEDNARVLKFIEKILSFIKQGEIKDKIEHQQIVNHLFHVWCQNNNNKFRNIFQKFIIREQLNETTLKAILIRSLEIVDEKFFALNDEMKLFFLWVELLDRLCNVYKTIQKTRDREKNLTSVQSCTFRLFDYFFGS